MSSSDYSVAVKLSLVNNVSSGLLTMGAQFAALSRQSDMLQAKLSSLRFQGQIGAGMLAFGAAIAAPMALAVKQAAKFEQQLFVIKSATQANVSEMENYRKAVERVATQSIFSSVKVAEIGKIIATTGNFKINELAQITESFTRFATVQNILKGTSYEASTKQGLQLAEITGHFDAKSINQSLNLLTKLGLIMPDNIQQVLGSMKYMQGTVKNVMGVEDEQGMLFVAMLNRMGISGTRAGSMLTAAISRSIPGVMGSGLWEGKSPQALAAMGMTDGGGKPTYFNQQGKFDAVKWMSTMGDYVRREFASNSPEMARLNIMRNFQFAYGANGARIAGLMSSPEALEQFQMLSKVMKTFPDLDKINEQVNQLFVKQLPQAVANLNTAFTKLGYTLLPLATKWLQYFNDNAEKLIIFMQNHEDAIRSFAEAFAWIAGLSILGGTLLLLKVGLSGLILPFQVLGTLLPVISGGLMALSVPGFLVAGAFALIGYALYKLYTGWEETKQALMDTGVWYYMERAFYYLGATMYHLIHPVETLKTAFNYLFDTISGWISKISNFVSDPFGNNDSSKQTLSFNGGRAHFAGDESPYIAKNSNMQLPASPNAMQGARAENQPIHVNLHVDGQKMASVVANHISNQALNMPNATSLFDTALSPMPPIINAIGIS